MTKMAAIQETFVFVKANVLKSEATFADKEINHRSNRDTGVRIDGNISTRPNNLDIRITSFLSMNHFPCKVSYASGMIHCFDCNDIVFASNIHFSL